MVVTRRGGEHHVTLLYGLVQREESPVLVLFPMGTENASIAMNLDGDIPPPYR